jgi:hypothetical protein
MGKDFTSASQNEIWKDIIGYEGLYQASNLGRIKSLPKWDGTHYTKIKILKNRIHSHGYKIVTLCKNKNKKNHLIHRLVLLSFIGFSNLQCNHKNGKKDDNRLCNLEYCTASENRIHAFKTGLQKPNYKTINEGEKSPNHKLKEKDVLFIRENYKKYNQSELSKLFNVSQVLISRILLKKAWKHI